ncbi:MAG TPA: hypothetical protein VIX90_06160 [Edaphobacter sp.]
MMKILGGAKLIVLSLLMHAPPSDTIPPVLIGRWDVGVPYNTSGPIGIDAKQEKFIRQLHLSYTAEHLRVCGKTIPIRPIKMKSLISDEFLETYGFLPHVIGMESSPIIDLTISPSDGMNACGEYEDPGVHVLIGSGGHIVMEVANDYFPLKKPQDPK